MSPLRRRRSKGSGPDPDATTIFFATDLHGSETCFRKFVAAARFYGAGPPVHLVEDVRFQRTDRFLAPDGFWPESAVYVTVPGGRLPEPFFIRYGYLEREEDLLVPVGRLGTRAYDVWRCGREAR